MTRGKSPPKKTKQNKQTNLKNTEYTKNPQTIYKRIFTEKQIEQFKLKLHDFDWAVILT